MLVQTKAAIGKSHLTRNEKDKLAFTGELLNEFKHSNIADNHICNVDMKKGYRCKVNTGGIFWGNGKWMFMRKVDDLTTTNG